MISESIVRKDALDALMPEMSDEKFYRKFGVTKEDYLILKYADVFAKDNGIYFYEPHEKQVEFHKSNAPYRMFCGANRSGKTAAGAAELVWYALGTHPYKKVVVPNEQWVVSTDYNVQKEASQRAVMALIPASEILGNPSHVKAGVIDTIYLKNGSVISFKSTDSGVSRFAGAAKRGIWFDEEPPKEIWQECIARIGAGVQLDIWLTMTPIFEGKDGRKIGMTWTYRDLYTKRDGKRIFCINVNLDDNPYLTVEQREEQKKKYDGVEYDIRIKGEFKLISGNMVFNSTALEKYQEETIKPLVIGYLNGKELVPMANGVLNVWQKPIVGKKYFIGADVGLGVGGDPSCAVVLDNDLTIVAEIHGNIAPDELGQHLIKLGKYYNECWIGVEANAFGIATLNEMKKVYAKLYFRYLVDERSDKRTKKLGWWTDAKSKPLMISEFAEVIRDRSIIIPSAGLVDELMTYVIDNQGSSNAEIGCHDDRIIAAMIAFQVRKKHAISVSDWGEQVSNYSINKVTGY